MSDTNSIPVGDIRFLDNCVPALTAGEYNINVTHTITEPSFGIDTAFPANQQFIVNAPRFTLPANSVQSCYPTPFSENDFHESLPFIVLNDKFLPWTRTLNGGSALAYPPSWLALMIFKPSELVYTIPPPPQQANPTYSTVRPINDILNPGSGTIGPNISLNDYEKSLSNLSASTIDIAGDVFQSLAPQLAELPYLAHLRQINTGGQTIDGLTGDGYYSVVVGNRLPDPSTSSLYMAHLVSLEGWESYLPGGGSTFPANTNARVITLNSWTFTNDTAGADFLELVNALSITPLCLPPPPAINAPANIAEEIISRYQNGYVALNYTTRLGENNFAWYRGPFNPTVPTMLQNTLPGYLDTDGGTPLTNPDDAIIYDPVNGVFDFSYSVAFETGKMATLANKSASLAIWQWKKDGIGLLQILANILNDQNGQSFTVGKNLVKKKPQEKPDWEAIVAILKETHAGHVQFMEYLVESLGKHFLRKEQKSGSPIRICDPSKLSSHNDPEKSAKYLPGLLSSHELKKLSETGEDPYVHIIKKLNKTINEAQ